MWSKTKMNETKYLIISEYIKRTKSVKPRAGIHNYAYTFSDAIKYITSIPDEKAFSDRTLGELIMRLEIESGKTAPQIYNDANLERAVYHGIINGISAKPKKKTLLAIAIGLHLDEIKLKKLINYCGYTFPQNATDKIVLYFINQQDDYRKHDISHSQYKERKAISDLTIYFMNLKREVLRSKSSAPIKGRTRN
jgi:hypothetical protein